MTNYESIESIAIMQRFTENAVFFLNRQPEAIERKK